MSVYVTTWVYDHAPKDAEPADMLVLLALADHANAEGGLSYPSVNRLSSMTRLSERGVQIALKRMVERGVIAVQYPATNKRPTVYCFPSFRGEQSAPQESASRGEQSSGLGRTECTSGGEQSAPKPSLEPLLEPSTVPHISPTVKKHAMYEGWKPDDGSIKYALEWGIDADDLPEVVEDFVSYWLEHPKMKRPGWDRAFKARVRDVAHQYRRKGGVRVASNGHVPHDASDPDWQAWMEVIRDKEHEQRTGKLPDEPTTKAIHYAVKAIGGWGKVDPSNSFQRRDFLAAHKAERLNQ